MSLLVESGSVSLGSRVVASQSILVSHRDSLVMMIPRGVYLALFAVHRSSLLNGDHTQANRYHVLKDDFTITFESSYISL